MIGTISQRTKAAEWTEAFASRTTVALSIVNDDGSVFDSSKAYVLAISDGATPLATTEDTNSTALTLSADLKTLSGALYLNTTELVTDRMDVSTQDQETYDIDLVSQDQADALVTGKVVVLKTDYFFGAEDPTGLTGGKFNDLASVDAVAAADTFAVYDVSTSAYLKATAAQLSTYILAQTTHAALTDVTSDQHHAQTHTVASHDTTATGANLNTLVSAGNADALHVHTLAGITDFDGVHTTLTGVTADQHHAQSHSTRHTDGSDDIRDATNAVKGLATAAQITNLEANTAARHFESHAIASHNDTTATGTELDTLTSAGNADALHSHAHSALTSVTTDQHHAQTHTVASHDTTATGAQLNTLVGGGSADALHGHAQYVVAGTAVLKDGTEALTADWDVGNFDLTAKGLTLDGTLTDGTASLAGGSLTAVKLGTLTTNGFVKTSGGDGTLSVDTNTYMASGLAVLKDGTEALTAAWNAGVFRITMDDLGLDDGVNQPYLITHRGDGIVFQGQTAGTFSAFEVFTADGDGTDTVQFAMYALGTPGDPFTNTERLIIAHNPTLSTWNIHANNIGGGVTMPINLYTAGNIGQLTLETAGDLSLKLDGKKFFYGAGQDSSITDTGAHMIIDADEQSAGGARTLKIAHLTSNGFVKTSGGDGALSVDTGTYVPTGTAILADGSVNLAGAWDLDSQWLSNVVIISGLAILQSTVVNEGVHVTDNTGVGGIRVNQSVTGLFGAIAGVASDFFGSGVSGTATDATWGIGVQGTALGAFSSGGWFNGGANDILLENGTIEGFGGTLTLLNPTSIIGTLDVTSTIQAGTSDITLTTAAGLLRHEAGGLEFDASGVVDGDFIVGTGAGTMGRESGATARASLGLGTIATQAANNVAITGGSVTGITDVAIVDGGTGQGTAQLAINALTAVSGATDEHVLTKDTGTGNAVFKAAPAAAALYTELLQVISAGADATWTAVDVSAFSAVGDVIEVLLENTAAGNERTAGVRTFGSALARFSDLHEAEQGGVTPLTMDVLVGSDAGTAKIEVYEEADADVVVTVIGKRS